MARRATETKRRWSRGCCFLSPWHRRAHTLPRTSAEAHAHARARARMHVHNRLEEFCVYSENKKWVRNVNIGLSDCRRTLAVIDFYKHPFRQVSELQEPPLHQRLTQRKRGKDTERVYPEIKLRVGHVTQDQYHDCHFYFGNNNKKIGFLK